MGSSMPTGGYPRPRRGVRGLIVAAAVLVTGAAVTAGVLIVLDDSPGSSQPLHWVSESAPPPEPDVPKALTSLTEVGRVTGKVGTTREVRPADPEAPRIEIAGDTAYVAHDQADSLAVSAVDLATAEVAWETTVETRKPARRARLVAMPGALLVDNDERRPRVLDAATGDNLRTVDGSVRFVVGDRLIQSTYSPDKDLLLEAVSGRELVSVDAPTDKPSHTWVLQETGESRALPHDYANDGGADAEVARGTEYVARGQKASGRTAVFDVESGDVVGEGNVGEKVTDYALFEDTLVVFRNTPQELAVYDVDDLGEPRWRKELPEADDGSRIDVCGKETLCLTLKIGSREIVWAYDMATGEIRWKNDAHSPGSPFLPVGELVAIPVEVGTQIVDAESGDVVQSLVEGGYVYAGQQTVIHEGSDLVAYDLAANEQTPLGNLPDGIELSDCEWNEAYAVCAERGRGPEPGAYVVFQYRR